MTANDHTHGEFIPVFEDMDGTPVLGELYFAGHCTEGELDWEMVLDTWYDELGLSVDMPPGVDIDDDGELFAYVRAQYRTELAHLHAKRVPGRSLSGIDGWWWCTQRRAAPGTFPVTCVKCVEEAADEDR